MTPIQKSQGKGSRGWRVSVWWLCLSFLALRMEGETMTQDRLRHPAARVISKSLGSSYSALKSVPCSGSKQTGSNWILILPLLCVWTLSAWVCPFIFVVMMKYLSQVNFTKERSLVVQSLEAWKSKLYGLGSGCDLMAESWECSHLRTKIWSELGG